MMITMKSTKIFSLLLCALLVISPMTGCAYLAYSDNSASVIDLDNIPPYSDSAYVEINGNIPFFTESDYTTDSFEEYGKQDYLGRCSTAYACIGKDLMPVEKRDSIGQIKPSGWQTVKYDIVDGKYLYNRCHLIGYQLSGENANPDNLITGTRYLNTEGMLPFEDMVTDYVQATDNHVLYRVTPVFTGVNLLADGVLMEGYSVEDEGKGIEFNVFVYNVQPGIIIDYSNGDSRLADEGDYSSYEISDSDKSEKSEYVINTNTNKFHTLDCPSVDKIKDNYKEAYAGNRDDLIDKGYEPCKICNP